MKSQNQFIVSQKRNFITIELAKTHPLSAYFMLLVHSVILCYTFLWNSLCIWLFIPGCSVSATKWIFTAISLNSVERISKKKEEERNHITKIIDAWVPLKMGKKYVEHIKYLKSMTHHTYNICKLLEKKNKLWFDLTSFDSVRFDCKSQILLKKSMNDSLADVSRWHKPKPKIDFSIQHSIRCVGGGGGQIWIIGFEIYTSVSRVCSSFNCVKIHFIFIK